MVKQPFTILIPSFRPVLARIVESQLQPLPVTHWDGTGYPSFAKLINDCIVNCPTERVVICSDKVSPSPEHILRMMTFLDEGYALVGLYYFACFGFPKELVRRIGFLDERFVGGECEDSDYMLRIRQANLAYRLSKEVPYTSRPSSWNNSGSRAHFIRKWGSIHLAEARRRLPEENYPDYSLGETVPTKFLPASLSMELR